jgi:hypothetical protein
MLPLTAKRAFISNRGKLVFMRQNANYLFSNFRGSEPMRTNKCRLSDRDKSNPSSVAIAKVCGDCFELSHLVYP